MKKITPRRENYLKLIHTLSKGGEVRGSDIADELDVKRPTVCVFLKRLVEYGDITMDEHHCIFLTQQGLTIAEETLDKHGVLLNLLRTLGVPDPVAKEDACAIEHSISPETFTAFKQLLQEREIRRESV